jgi:hypothetical protein
MMGVIGRLLRNVRAGEYRSPLAGAGFAASDGITVTSAAFSDGGTMPAAGAPTLVEVILSDGSRLSTACDVNTPERDLALQRRRVEQKFRTITTGHLGADGAAAVIAAVEKPAAALDMRALAKLSC